MYPVLQHFLHRESKNVASHFRILSGYGAIKMVPQFCGYMTTENILWSFKAYTLYVMFLLLFISSST